MKYTKQILEPIVKESTSFLQVLKRLGKQSTGGNNSYIRKVVKKFNIDTSHFKSKGWNKGMKFPSKYPIEDYLSNKKPIHSSQLRKRLIKEGLFDKKCNHCGLSEWTGHPIALELHHIDMNHENNNLSNLNILCANCHELMHSLARDCHKSKTKTTKSKSKTTKSKSKRKIQQRSKNNTCKQCHSPTHNKHYCSYSCSRKSSRKVDRPSYDVLIRELEESNYVSVGRKYGVSDNAVRKWLKSYNSKVSTN